MSAAEGADLAAVELPADAGAELVSAVELLRQAVRRLGEVVAALDGAELVVPGSTGQLRPHPLLAEERAARDEVTGRRRAVEHLLQSHSLSGGRR